MNIAIVYYSQFGNTDKIATDLKAKLENTETAVDLIRIAPLEAYPDKGFKKFFFGGKAATFGERPDLEPYSFPLEKYDKVIIGSPLWAGTVTPPLRTFIDEQHKADRIDALGEKLCGVFYSCSGGKADKAFKVLCDAIGTLNEVPCARFVDPKDKPYDSYEDDLAVFAGDIRMKF